MIEMVTDRDKKVRREIANSNERRRMQSINAGFQGLRSLLPHHEGEKLSKASILQQTAEYIYSLEREKTRLLSQNVQLKRLLNLGGSPHGSASAAAAMLVEDASASLKRRRDNEADETALQLLRERQLRIELEAKLRSTESELSSSRTALEKLASPKNYSSKTSPPRKVQVEPLIKSSSSSERIVSTDPHGQRSYIVTTNNSRQNLDSIVEAIRHLEGDHLFSSEEVGPNQVVKEEVVESVSSTENENTKSSSAVYAVSSSLALPSTKPTPSPITVNGPVTSSNFVILKQELKSP